MIYTPDGDLVVYVVTYSLTPHGEPHVKIFPTSEDSRDFLIIARERGFYRITRHAKYLKMDDVVEHYSL